VWILKKFKELLENSKSHDFSKIYSIKIYHFSTAGGLLVPEGLFSPVAKYFVLA
jgi:hypothetical protein